MGLSTGGGAGKPGPAGGYAKDVSILSSGTPDGTTDNYPAMAGAQQQIPSDGKLYLRASSTDYRLGSTFVVNKPDIEIYGDGSDKTRVRALAACSLVYADGTTPLKSLRIRGITFDGGNFDCNLLSTRPTGNMTDLVDVREVKAKRIGGGTAVYLNGTQRAIVEDLEVLDPLGKASAVTVQEFCRETTLTRIRTRGAAQGIVLVPNGPNPQIDKTWINEPHLHAGCYTRPAFYASSSATYTATSVTDAATDFGSAAFTPGGPSYYFRILNAVRATGAITGSPSFGNYLSRFLLDDSTKDFRTLNINPGDIIESAGRRARVKIALNQACVVEDWFDKVTFEQTDAPARGSTYTIWQTVYGTCNVGVAAGTHTLGTDRNWWHDTQGNPVTPTNGAVYEMIPMATLGYGGIHLSGQKGSRHTWIKNGYVRESPADAFSVFVGFTYLSGCVAEDNDDQSYTCNVAAGDGPLYLSDSVARGAGRGGLYAGSENLQVSNFYVEGWGSSMNTALYPTASYAMFIGGARSHLRGLRARALGRVCEHSAVQVSDSVDMQIEIDSVEGLAVSVPITGGAPSPFTKPVWCYGSGGAFDRVRIKYAGVIDCEAQPGQSAVGPLVEVELQASPNGIQPGAIGSVALNTVTGLQHVKSAGGVAATGWQVVTTVNEPDFDPRPLLTTRLKAWHRVQGNIVDVGGVADQIVDRGVELKNLAAPTAGARPAYGAQAKFGGRVVLSGGSAGDKMMATAAWSSAMAQPATVVLCGSMPVKASFSAFYTNLSNGLFMREDNGSFEVYSGGSLFGSGIDPMARLLARNDPFVMIIEYDSPGGAIRVWVNNASPAPDYVFAGNGANTLDGFCILDTMSGGAPFGWPSLGSYFSEAMHVTGKLTNAQRQAVVVGIGNINTIGVRIR